MFSLNIFIILLCREIGQRATSVRSCYDITCSENAVEFLTELGCRLEFEYIAKGFVFRKGRMKITGILFNFPLKFIVRLQTLYLKTLLFEGPQCCEPLFTSFVKLCLPLLL